MRNNRMSTIGLAEWIIDNLSCSILLFIFWHISKFLQKNLVNLMFNIGLAEWIIDNPIFFYFAFIFWHISKFLQGRY